MNFKKLMRGAAMLCASSILWVSCKKENETINLPQNEVSSSNLRHSGAMPVDPLLMAKVPIITSSDFLADKITNYYSSQPNAESARGGGNSRDRTTPTVSIINPVTGSTVNNTVSVQVSASDNVAVSSVVLKVDGNTIGTSSTAPYNFSWNTAGLSSGTHTLTATASDAAGNSKIHTIQVGYNTPAGSDITPPSVSITSPVNGASVTSTITISASASDNVGVSAVTFKVDGATIATDNSSPYSVSWNTSTVSAGIHTLSVTAADAAGNNSSSSIQVTVNTTVAPPTSLPVSYQLLMPPVGSQGGEGSCVAFAAGYGARSAEYFYSTGASSYSYATNIFSPEFLYNQTKYFDYCSSGTDIVSVLEFMKSTGICKWQSMPYSDLNGCSLLPTNSQLTEASNFKITSYSAIYNTDITAIKTMIVNKHPLTIMVNLDASMNGAQPGFIWSSFSGTAGAGHALVICGYDDTKHAFKVMNSWGTAWGDAGYSWINYDFLRQAAGMWAFVINP